MLLLSFSSIMSQTMNAAVIPNKVMDKQQDFKSPIETTPLTIKPDLSTKQKRSHKVGKEIRMHRYPTKLIGEYLRLSKRRIYSLLLKLNFLLSLL